MPEDKQQSNLTKKSGARTEQNRAARRVRLDTSKVTTAYCNFFTAQQGPEEVVLNFGLHQRWDPNQKDLTVQMLQQVVLHPAAVRRLRDLLDKLITDREARTAPAKAKAE